MKSKWPNYNIWKANCIARTKRRRYWLDVYKVAKGCEICHYNTHPNALQFDHLPTEEKKQSVALMITHSLKNLFAEIRKCRVLCANCHMVHSAKQRRKV